MTKKIAGISLIVVGLAIIITALGMRWYGLHKQKNIMNQFEKTIEKVDKSEGNKTEPAREVAEGTIGIIQIPKIDLKVAVSEGVDMDTLNYAVGHFPDTALPGQNGNFCLAGHRSYTYSEFFNRLDEVDKGDEIIIITKNGQYKYKIYDKMVVEPKDYWVLDPSKDAEITLVTCTPIRVATQRLIVKGKLES